MFTKKIIYKNNLINNAKQLKAHNPQSLICSMVKANAYGVGAKEVVKILNNYVDFFGVSNTTEAQQIQSLTTKKILIVGALEKYNINPKFSYTCHCLKDVLYLLKLNKKVKIHLKVNTGMNRFGFNSIIEFKQVLNILKSSNLILEGIFTHFATTDQFVDKQMSKFKQYILACKQANFNPIIHCDNSFVNEFKNHNLDMVRVGFNLYNRNDKKFAPAVKIKSKIVQINSLNIGDFAGYNKKYIATKKTNIAVIPIGYADGFDSRLIGIDICIKNKPCKIVNICMDCTLVDISNFNIKKDDDVWILNNVNSLKKYANYLQISEYEMMTKFSNIRADIIIT